MESFDHICVSISDQIATVTVDRPEVRNAMDVPTRRELRTAFEALREEAIRVVVLRGAGDDCFVSGADIETLAEMDVVDAMEYAAHYSQGLYNDIATFPVPTIAAIDGYCLGGGLELALACDIRVATPNAQFGLPEVTLGVIPGGGGTQRLQTVVGAGVARKLILTGDHIDAATAERYRLVTDVYDPSEFDAAVGALAETVASNAPIAVRLAKESLNRGLDIDGGLAFERAAFIITAATADKDEGTAAFLANRDPVFEGR